MANALFIPFVASAQQITNSRARTVTDQQDVLVTSASITATNLDTGLSRAATANEYGEYRIDDLLVGRYTVEITAPRFITFVQTNITLTVDQVLYFEATLAAGAKSQMITVT